MIDHLAHIRADTRRIAEIASTHDLETPVPTCGDWKLADLTWHIAEVQHFWAWIVAERAQDPSRYEEPVRPAEDGVAVFLDDSNERLLAALDAADPADACWSWTTDHTVGFTRRRQTHEALIHRVDAELAVDAFSAIDDEVADDGIDELLTVFLSGIPHWAEFAAGKGVIRVTASDTARSWICRFGRMTGTSPDSGRGYDVEALMIDPSSEPDTEISADAATLDLWLWGRGDQLSTVSGDRELARRLRAAIVDSTQ